MGLSGEGLGGPRDSQARRCRQGLLSLAYGGQHRQGVPFFSSKAISSQASTHYVASQGVLKLGGSGPEDLRQDGIHTIEIW